MKVGDLVKWTSPGDLAPGAPEYYRVDYGVIVKLSQTGPGHRIESAFVRRIDGSMEWFDTRTLEVLSESR